MRQIGAIHRPIALDRKPAYSDSAVELAIRRQWNLIQSGAQSFQHCMRRADRSENGAEKIVPLASHA